MDTNLAIFEPWKKVLPKDIEALYAEIIGIEKEIPICAFELRPIENSANPDDTLAEKYGRRIKLKFNFYSAFLDLIKSDRDWIAFERHSMDHVSYSGEYTIIDDDQVRAYYFDPLAFNFKWWDNTLDFPFTPWNWQVDLIPKDLDDNHIFYCREKKWLLRCSLKFYDGTPTFEVFDKTFSDEIGRSLEKWLLVKKI